MLCLTIYFHIETKQLLRTMWTENMFNIFSRDGIGLHFVILFLYAFSYFIYQTRLLWTTLELMTTQYIKYHKYEPWSNHIFSQGARSHWPVRRHCLFIKTQPFHATASYWAHNSLSQNSKNISDSPGPISAIAKMYHCVSLLKKSPECSL
jgi:hypothetical protein